MCSTMSLCSTTGSRYEKRTDKSLCLQDFDDQSKFISLEKGLPKIKEHLRIDSIYWKDKNTKSQKWAFTYIILPVFEKGEILN
jgi:hypothetical protein